MELREIMNMDAAEETAIHVIGLTDEDLDTESLEFRRAGILEELYSDEMPDRYDGLPEEWEIGEYNRRMYATRRGRECEYPGCDHKLRYTREVPVCWRHELTDFAAAHPVRTRALQEPPRNPVLYGLRVAMERAGVKARELSEIMGHTSTNPPGKWIHQLLRYEFGVDADTRARLAHELGVSEEFLLEGLS